MSIMSRIEQDGQAVLEKYGLLQEATEEWLRGRGFLWFEIGRSSRFQYLMNQFDDGATIIYKRDESTGLYRIYKEYFMDTREKPLPWVNAKRKYISDEVMVPVLAIIMDHEGASEKGIKVFEEQEDGENED